MKRLLLALAGTLAFGRTAESQAILPPDFEDHLIVGGLATPTGMAFLPDGRVLVTEQLTARIRLIVGGALSPIDPVVTVPGVRNDNFFRGLLGIAVDPRWPTPPHVYVHYAGTNGRVMLSRFTAAGDLAFQGDGALTIDPATRYDLFADIFDAAHNGGTLRFGPDSMLYASVGDSFTVPCAAQRIGSLRGVVLRLEVRRLPAGPGGPPPKSLLAPTGNPFPTHPDSNARLVWARGLRNPFRFQIDPASGEVFIGDVGENVWEEIDLAAPGGLDFGWPLFEGPDPYTTCPGAPPTLTPPIHAFNDGQSVIPAALYRRPGGTGFPPEYDGEVFFSDYYHGALRRLRRSGATWSIAPPVSGQVNATDWATGLDEVSDYHEASDGSLWYCRQGVAFAANTGQIRRIAYVPPVGVPEGAPRGLVFLAPRPSPAHAGVELAYWLPRRASVELSIHDLMGRRVRVIESGDVRGSGSHRAAWDGRDGSGRRVAAGVYLVRLSTGGETIAHRIVIAI